MRFNVETISVKKIGTISHRFPARNPEAFHPIVNQRLMSFRVKSHD